MPRRFPETLTAHLPAGYRDRIERIAQAEERSPAEWLRRATKRALETAERADRRRRQARTARAEGAQQVATQ